MAKIESAFFDIGYMDTLSAQETFVHRLDPRTKLMTTLIFIVAVVFAVAGGVVDHWLPVNTDY